MTDVKRILIIGHSADSTTARLRREDRAFAVTDDRGFIPFVSPVTSQLAAPARSAPEEGRA